MGEGWESEKFQRLEGLGHTTSGFRAWGTTSGFRACGPCLLLIMSYLWFSELDLKGLRDINAITVEDGVYHQETWVSITDCVFHNKDKYDQGVVS